MQQIPTAQQLYNDILNDLLGEYGFMIPLFGKNVFRAVAAVQAGKIMLLHRHIGKVQQNIFVDTAEPASKGGTLERFGRVKLNRNPFPARAAEYDVQMTGSTGALIPGGTTFNSDDESQNAGMMYQLDQDHTMQAATDTITVRALVGGLDAQLNTGDTMTATSPIAGVDEQGEVTATSTEPRAPENIEDYRKAVEEAFRLEPQGAAAADYRLWSLDVQGVRLSYPYSIAGAPNEVDLYVETNYADSIVGKGEPDQLMLDEVDDVVHLDPDTTKPLLKRGRRPIDDNVNVKAVTPLDVNITINNYQNLTSNLQNQIESALEEHIFEVRPFIAGIDAMTERSDTLSVNDIIYIINTVQVAQFDSVDLVVNGSTITGSFQFTDGDIPYLNSVTFA